MGGGLRDAYLKEEKELQKRKDGLLPKNLVEIGTLTVLLFEKVIERKEIEDAGYIHQLNDF